MGIIGNESRSPIDSANIRIRSTLIPSDCHCMSISLEISRPKGGVNNEGGLYNFKLILL